MLFLAKNYCTDLQPVINLLKSVLTIIQWGIPILLIVMGSIDLGKAVLASDDKEIKGATSKLIKRAIAAVAVFFIPMLVNLIFGRKFICLNFLIPTIILLYGWREVL